MENYYISKFIGHCKYQKGLIIKLLRRTALICINIPLFPVEKSKRTC